MHTRTIDRDTFTVPGAGEYDTTRASLKIQDGCDLMCTFCLIPFARGHERSRDFDDLTRQARDLAARGHREIVLTGVNIGRYRDGRRTLMDVIDGLELIAGLDRIRISSIEPTTIPDALLDRMADSSKVCRHLHVPLQSGDDAILGAMKRRYTADDYAAFVERAAARVPGLAVGTDVMVGFPGETEAAFERTVRLATELPFSYLHVFSYSERPGTAASRLLGAVPSSVIAARSRALSDLSRARRLAFYRGFEGRDIDVLFEKSRERGWQTGLTDNFIRVGVRTDRTLTGERHAVRITGVMDGLAVGTLRDA
jgi:threonylcarbamoyladenosine tRNA methylthiotransferase MtaB